MSVYCVLGFGDIEIESFFYLGVYSLFSGFLLGVFLFLGDIGWCLEVVLFILILRGRGCY